MSQRTIGRFTHEKLLCVVWLTKIRFRWVVHQQELGFGKKNTNSNKAWGKTSTVLPVPLKKASQPEMTGQAFLSDPHVPCDSKCGTNEPANWWLDVMLHHYQAKIMCIYIYIYIWILLEIIIYIYIHTHSVHTATCMYLVYIYIYNYLYIYIYVCVHLFCAVHEFEAYQANLNIFRPVKSSKCHPGSDEVPSQQCPVARSRQWSQWSLTAERSKFQTATPRDPQDTRQSR